MVVILMPVPGGGGGGVRRPNRSLSRGVEQNRSLSRGPEGIYKSVPRRWRYNISMSRGAFIHCPGEGGGGGGGTLLSSVGVYG